MRKFTISVLLKNVYCLFFLVFFMACDKESVEPTDTEMGYIRGNFGSQYLNFTEPLYNQPSYNVYEPEIFSNVYYYGPNQNQINLIRNDDKQNPTKSIQIYLDINLDILQVPYEFGAPNSIPGTSATLQLMDLSMSQDTAFGSLTDPFNYYGGSYQDLKVM